MVTLPQLQDLQTPEGSALLNEVHELAPTSRTAIAVTTRLRKTYPGELVTAALTIHDLRVRARAKFSRADEMWFTRNGLEQATSEAIAGYRAHRFTGQTGIVDLCCGIGGDLVALARQTTGATIRAVDLDPLHLAMAALNAGVYGATGRITFIEGDVRAVDPGQDAVFIDPARRSERGRMSPGDSEPPLDWCLALTGNDRAIGIKCAPGLDHDRVPAGWEFEAIALGPDLKEAVLWSPSLARTRAAATIVTEDIVHRLEPFPGDPVSTRTPEIGDTLLDPNPAVTRAGLVEDLARVTGADRIDVRIGFLVSDAAVSTPFARALQVIASGPWHERSLKRQLRELDAGPIDIRRRGLAGDVDAITKRLRGKGSRPLTIAMTRVDDEPWAIICESDSRQPGS